MNKKLLIKSIFEGFVYVSKGSLNIPEYRCLFIGRVLQVYTMEPDVENIV